MTIYGRFGGEVRITADCGMHQPSYLTAPCHLVSVEFVEDGKQMYRFAEFLKATNGWSEIEKAIQDAPEIKELTHLESRFAYREAE